MIVAVSNDHRGVRSSKQIRAIIAQLGHECLDLTHKDEQSVDYPDYAYEAAMAVATGKAQRAILVCGTGIGMCIAANKVKGIRAALCYDELAAKISRQHNDANVLCLSGDLLGPTMLRKMVEVWLSTEFEGGRHYRRVKKIQAIEEGRDPREVGND
ncbi:MAG TPA: ribose 5-phosphate isomerase B [Anaerohalosphaeraceae bacterium]|jgi:ribose 5-phosphate isomerase B|nr:ribose 5-phosphate isomerase B [Anaerohalosphaeraceae bacterium]HQG06177.1 ribose 5-phosphate isomerase B [Anaerohalosphaeraceae bacterium]HQI06621.1 ribose 5-phosphate isomerase B [Anaerohalosphaeraceae bacterium]HQJ68062.1 ribose 5-phosphate isomerase B [Anaerohalosphaeraceae bacterium]